MIFCFLAFPPFLFSPLPYLFKDTLKCKCLWWWKCTSAIRLPFPLGVDGVNLPWLREHLNHIKPRVILVPGTKIHPPFPFSFLRLILLIKFFPKVLMLIPLLRIIWKITNPLIIRTPGRPNPNQPQRWNLIFKLKTKYKPPKNLTSCTSITPYAWLGKIPAGASL